MLLGQQRNLRFIIEVIPGLEGSIQGITRSSQVAGKATSRQVSNILLNSHLLVGMVMARRSSGVPMYTSSYWYLKRDFWMRAHTQAPAQIPMNSRARAMTRRVVITAP